MIFSNFKEGELAQITALVRRGNKTLTSGTGIHKRISGVEIMGIPPLVADYYN